MAAANSSAPITTPTTSSTTFISSTTEERTSSSIIATSSTQAITQPPTTDQSSVALITSVVTESPTDGGQPTTIIITSTASNTPVVATSSTSQSIFSSSGAASSSAALATTTHAASKSSGGLSGGGKVAVAVVVPVVAVALIVVAALWYWRRRKQQKNSEELRKKEIEEYGYNPNNDPTLPPVGSATDGTSELRDDSAGYRGWGATSSTQRQPSTTLSGSNKGIGMALSDEGSNQGGYNQPGSPTQGYANEPIVGSPPHGGRPQTTDSEAIGALPPVGGDGPRQDDIHRGTSNASSTYSAANRSEGSADAPIPVNSYEQGGQQQYYDEGLYFDDRAQPSHGPYGDGTYGGGLQPVIQNVQARRNTRIEKPTVYPPQGNSGIAQNF